MGEQKHKVNERLPFCFLLFWTVFLTCSGVIFAICTVQEMASLRAELREQQQLVRSLQDLVSAKAVDGDNTMNTETSDDNAEKREISQVKLKRQTSIVDCDVLADFLATYIVGISTDNRSQTRPIPKYHIFPKLCADFRAT